MVSAGSRALHVSSMGYDGPHRIWRVRSDRRPGEFAHVSGPQDSMEALLKAANLANAGALHRLPWLPDDGGLSPTGYVRRHPRPDQAVPVGGLKEGDRLRLVGGATLQVTSVREEPDGSWTVEWVEWAG